MGIKEAAQEADVLLVATPPQSAEDLAAQMAEYYDFGGADKVQLQEQFALAWINLAIMQGMGRDIDFKLIRRK